MSKKTIKDLYRHSKKRASERYDLYLDEQTYSLFGKLIRHQNKQRAQLLWNESNSRAHYFIDGIYLVIWDRKRGCIATFLPPDAIHNYLPLINGVPSIRYYDSSED